MDRRGFLTCCGAALLPVRAPVYGDFRVNTEALLQAGHVDALEYFTPKGWLPGWYLKDTGVPRKDKRGTYWLMMKLNWRSGNYYPVDNGYPKSEFSV